MNTESTYRILPVHTHARNAVNDSCLGKICEDITTHTAIALLVQSSGAASIVASMLLKVSPVEITTSATLGRTTKPTRQSRCLGRHHLKPDHGHDASNSVNRSSRARIVLVYRARTISQGVGCYGVMVSHTWLQGCYHRLGTWFL